MLDFPLIQLRRERGEEWGAIAADMGMTGEALRNRFRRWRAGAGLAVTHEAPEWPDWKRPAPPNWREWLDAFDSTLELHKRADNIVSKVTIDLSYLDIPMMMASVSDLHMGGGFTNHKAIRRTIEMIMDTPGMYVGIAGDSIEGFIPGQKGAASSDQMAGSLGAQLHAAESLVDDLTEAGKLLYWTWGDHDAKWFEDRVGVNVMKRLVDKKIPYFAGRGLIKMLVGDATYYLHVNHGEKYKSILNETHPQKRMYDLIFPADVTISGHLHKPAYHVAYHYEHLRDFGIPLGGKAIFVQNGTFKTGPDPYSTRWWSHGIMGVPTLVFRADEREVDVFESPAKALQFVEGAREMKDDEL